jgi:hypothetical protein
MHTFVTVLSVKGQVKNGFFVEAGADDFERDSNTLYFEVTILSGLHINLYFEINQRSHFGGKYLPLLRHLWLWKHFLMVWTEVGPISDQVQML